MLVQAVLILGMHSPLEELKETTVKSIVVAGSGQQVKQGLEVLPWPAFPGKDPALLDYHQLK